jgi:type I restriction enzyme S subunit
VAVSQVVREIELLREYHSRLIADVVTGKLDVRTAAADLPELAGEPDAIGLSEEIEDEEDPLDDVVETDEAAA